jgi:carbamoyl-phosphate synthase/aspartate carbamoyltransferase/dihydroorotase
MVVAAPAAFIGQNYLDVLPFRSDILWRMSDLILPGLVDVHTHLRVPGGEQKEDFQTGTAAALAGGITTILAMPNTSPPLTTPEVIRATYEQAQANIRCELGLFAGASPEHVEHLPALAAYAVALKIYLNDTFGPLRVEDVPTLLACFRNWPREKMVAMHAEKQSVAVGIGLAAAFDRPVHFCHISRREEIELIATAKQHGLPVTCEVTPHHLYLTEEDASRLGPLGDMRPVLGSAADVAALWEHLNDTVDCIATDHAPHTLAEKMSDRVPPGVPGLETSLALLLTAVHHNRLTLDRLIELMATNPRRIYGLAEPADTKVTVEMIPYTIHHEGLQTKCGWTPFAGREVVGRVKQVVVRGEVVMENGRVLAAPGSGSMLV